MSGFPKPIQIDFKGHRELLEKVVSDLTGPFPACWNLVVPPGFDGERFGDQLADKLRAHAILPRVAAVGTDARFPTISAFVRELHRQWINSKSPPKPLHKSADCYLDSLLRHIAESEPRAILILKRFHKVLESLNLWVLAKFREAEQSQARYLRTVTVTYVPYAELKRRWEAQKHYFARSDYGDTHCCEVVEPMPRGEILEYCRTLDIPDAVTDVASKLTGGYPEPMRAVLEFWIGQDRPQLRPELRLRLREVAETHLRNFVEWLDPSEDRQFRDHVINLYHGVDVDRAYEAFGNHPWKGIVLDQDRNRADGLRAECVGWTSEVLALNDATKSDAVNSLWSDKTRRARLLYERRQFETALKVLDRTDPRFLSPHDLILRGHAQIMNLLSGDDGEGHLGEDTNSRKLRQAIEAARGLIQQLNAFLEERDRTRIVGRYEELLEVARALSQAASVQGRYRGRVVDILAGLAGVPEQNPRAAALLLLSKFEAAKSLAGDASACQFALFLPEQVFRVWALWELGINFYQAPELPDETWRDAEKEWPIAHCQLHRTQPGEEFVSFYSFAYLALAAWRRQGVHQARIAPESDFESLRSALSCYEEVRTGKSHGMCLTSAQQRRKYFSIIDRWLGTLITACPQQSTREGLCAILTPLPIVDANGVVIW